MSLELELIKLANDFIEKTNTEPLLENIKKDLEQKYKDKDTLNINNQIASIELYILAYQLLNPRLLNDFQGYTNTAIQKTLSDLNKCFNVEDAKTLKINELFIFLNQTNEYISKLIRVASNEIKKNGEKIELYNGLKILHSTKSAELKAKKLLLNAFSEPITTKSVTSLKNSLDNITENLMPIIDTKEIIANPEELFEVDNIEMLKTNFNYLNKTLGGGFATQNLYTLCGASGKGKTTLAIQLISDFAKQGIKSAFISLEMGRKELLSRFTANLSSVPYYKIKNHRMKIYSLTDEEKAKIINANDNLKNIAIVGKKALKELSLLEQVIKHLAQNNYKFCVIDTKDQIKITNYKGESYEKHNDIANSLKELSMEQNISILLLSQTNRSLDNLKKGEFPNKSHISLSDGTYTQSDGISFIYTEPESKTLALYTDKSRYASKSDEVQMIEIDKEHLRVREINTTHTIDEVG